MIEGNSGQLMELKLFHKDGLSSEIRTITVNADPVKLQTLLYGKSHFTNR